MFSKKVVLNNKLYLKLILLLGLIIDLMWILNVNTLPYSDFSYYNELAKQIASGGQWGDTYTSVGYAIFLGGLYKIFGSSLIIPKIFNILLTIINNILFIKILNKINAKDFDKKLMVLLFVIFPNNIFYTSLVCTEILFTTILLAITTLYFGNYKHKYLIIGILVGANTMIKPFFLVFFFLIFLCDAICYKNIINALKNSILILIISLLVLSPWIYRNTKLIGEFTYVSNNGGIVLYINNNSQNKYGRWMPATDVQNSMVNTIEYKNANITEKNKLLSKAAKEWIKAHPIQFLELGIKRLFNTYLIGDDITYTFYGAGLSQTAEYLLLFITNIIRNIVFIPSIIYILVKFISIIKKIIIKDNDISLSDCYIVLLFFMFTCVYFVTEGQGRYAFPLIFVFIYEFYNVFKNIINKKSSN